MTRHSSEDAISDAEFDELLAAADELSDPYRAECRLVLVATGRLGLRAGEVCHLREAWIDWDKQQIRIPRHDACDCGYCLDRADAAAGADPALDRVTARDQRWNPKTPQSARAVPFGFDEQVADVLRSYFFFHDNFPRSRSAINRRVDRVLRAAGYPEDYTYPHALRATAASYHAFRGLPPAALQSLFGWADLATANKYVRLSGGATAKALAAAHSE